MGPAKNIMKPKACIILPTYNEAENIQHVVRGIFSQTKQIISHDLHVLVVAGGCQRRPGYRLMRAQGFCQGRAILFRRSV